MSFAWLSHLRFFVFFLIVWLHDVEKKLLEYPYIEYARKHCYVTNLYEIKYFTNKHHEHITDTATGVEF